MSNLPQALKEAYARSKSSTRHLLAIELQHSTFPSGVLRWVNYDTDLTVDGDIYVGHAIEMREPAVGAEPDEKMKVVIDGVPGSVQFWINNAIQSSTNIYADVRPFAFNMDTESVIDIVGVYSFVVSKVSYDMTQVQLTMGHLSPTNMAFPNRKYDPLTYPALFR
jgi:hypothetical protein